jgi:hypothetical protein
MADPRNNEHIGVTVAAGTTTQTLGPHVNDFYRGIKVILDQTVNAGSAGSITLSILGYDKTSNKTWVILAGAAVAAVATNVYTVYPGIIAVTNVSANDVLPDRYEIVVTANNANPVTYTVAWALLP